MEEYFLGKSWGREAWLWRVDAKQGRAHLQDIDAV